MNKTTTTIFRYLFVVILGVLLHYFYEWSGNKFFVGLFAPVNESVWEHLKLLFFPMLLLTIWDLITNFEESYETLSARVIGILAGMVFIVTVYYTISGIIGKEITWINIVNFLLGVAFAFWIEKRIHQRDAYYNPVVALISLVALTVLFAVFTVMPPEIGLFVTSS